MDKDSAIHNIAGVAATIIVLAMLVGGGVYVYKYFNSAKIDIVANDLKIEIEKQGTGEGAKRGDTVMVNYIGMLANGTEFDNSYKRGSPIPVTLGDGQVIKGWEEGLLGMKVGEKRKLTIPPSLGYGPNDYGPIPGNSTLIFETEMMAIKPH
jgi:FK506-binding protein 2